jgi:hypothetical protein
MKRASVLAFLVLILAVGALPAVAITGGDLDGEGHPNVGLLAAFKEGVYQWRCSGTLIDEQVFLTAGHCLENGVDLVRIWFESDLTDLTDYSAGTAIEGMPVLHPEYAWVWPDPHDVGVVILDEPVTWMEPAALPPPDWLGELKSDGILTGGYGNSNKEDGVFFRSVGYGGTLETWPPPVLTYDKIRQVSESEYVALTKTHLHLSQKAVFDESGSCFGDSGGPVFWVHPDTGQETIVAVTSSGDGQCVATGLNYRVDVEETLSWIYAQFP